MFWDLLICPVEGSPVNITWKLFPWAGQIIQHRIFQTCSWGHVPAARVWEPSLGPQTDLLMGVDSQFSLFRLTFTPAPSSHSQQPSPLVPLVPEDPLLISLERDSHVSCTAGEGTLLRRVQARRAVCTLQDLPWCHFSSLRLAEGSSIDCHLSLALPFESFHFVLIGS